jgi:hypothetical protein
MAVILAYLATPCLETNAYNVLNQQAYMVHVVLAAPELRGLYYLARIV